MLFNIIVVAVVVVVFNINALINNDSGILFCKNNKK